MPPTSGMPPSLVPMTPPKFSVLLLAWDDADPGVTVLGGEALPATWAMVYQLAAQQPVLAVYPHLPAEAAPATVPPQPPAGRPDKKAGLAGLAISDVGAAAEPGVHRLPLRGGAIVQSRAVGLHDLSPARSAQPQTILPPPAVTSTRQVPALMRSQWPPAPASGQPAQWQEPTAPYVGASAAATAAGTVVPVPVVRGTGTIPPRVPVGPAPERWSTQRPQAGDLRFDPDPELPTMPQPLVFDEPTAEIGAAGLLTAEDELLPNEATPPPPLPLTAAAVAESAPRLPVVIAPALDGLNFRMIQYARQAAQLVRDRRDFGVIYAPNWPAWLAALEIRNSSRQPLVLYVANLAADCTAPAERGWLLEVERMALRRATLILVPDETLLGRLRTQYGSTIGEVRVVAAADEQQVQHVLSEVAAG